MTTATKTDWRESIYALDPCGNARDWLATQASPAEAWANCRDGSWMLWLLGKLAGKPWSQARRKLVLAACECARLALPRVKAGENRPRKAIELAEQWARGGRVSRQALNDAADAAAYAAADVAGAAAYATAAAYAAAAADADAADAAAYAAAAYQEKRAEVLAKCADIVRKHYPKPPRMPK